MKNKSSKYSINPAQVRLVISREQGLLLGESLSMCYYYTASMALKFVIKNLKLWGVKVKPAVQTSLVSGGREHCD